MFDLQGKVALVTGSSRGIGRKTAEALATQGAFVFVHYGKNEAQAREVADGIVSRGGQAAIVGFDVANTKETEARLEAVIKQQGKLDILVANAGIAVDNLLLRVTDEQMDALFHTNVRGAIVCAKAATRSMMRQKWGRLIFLSSIVGEMGNAGQVAYAATKAALLGAAKTLAREYASRNITCNVIAPGFIDTDMTQVMSEAQKESLTKMIPLARTGRAEEIAAGAVYLASEEASYVTGQVLRINGGMYM